MKTLIKYFARRYILQAVNDALEAASSNYNVDKYIAKIGQIVEFLQTLVTKLDDKKLTEDEADEIIEKTKELF